ncbi:30S ribosome-binding factor RbfA [Melissococcus plutonius]|uniref:Ribosome-binding factor A n=2 Tax=Melissococcus plutonius TaxID=33970 RepID=F3YB51_MELPT|nr:30S ribosome-binding factor RbfA [Melissococcus plutonius]AIM25153.1 ribosome-binding factor A [Melissococcus plutonius S1]KMT25409.1 ribosome-binding factor A [Melissococcus plutonius]KMT25449.1 ribosome-binding factor A [Melissococcus plutonius]KMT26313.1 ribosome-binding factor A [Melissococcus plutonius]KMT29055.1 ribosome-binding factor A [Melissococcus plutonius]
MTNYRDRRVGQEILHEINDILRKKIRDPRLQEITITDVRVTGDLQQATIYYSLLSDLASDQQKVQQGLEKAKGLIRRELGQRLTLYKTPELFFEKDESVQYGNHVDKLLRELNKDE